MASDLKYSGYDVVLSSVAPHNSKLKMFKILGNIKIEGMFSKYREPVVIPTDFIEKNTPKAIERTDIIMINTPAFAQEVYEELIGKYGKKGQIVVFPCGGFSAVNFHNYLKGINRENDFYVCETGSFIYTTKLTGLGSVLIKDMKKSVGMLFGVVFFEFLFTFADKSSLNGFITTYLAGAAICLVTAIISAKCPAFKK